jgi:hypothetical protein
LLIFSLRGEWGEFKIHALLAQRLVEMGEMWFDFAHQPGDEGDGGTKKVFSLCPMPQSAWVKHLFLLFAPFAYLAVR